MSGDGITTGDVHGRVKTIERQRERVAGSRVRGNESKGKKRLDSIRHPFRLFVTEHGSDEHQPNYTHR